MVLSWMVYASAVGLLVGLAALVVEAALRLGGRPTRWVWLLATGVALAIPTWAWWAPASTADGTPGLGDPVPVYAVVSWSPRPEAPPLRIPDLSAFDDVVRTGWLIVTGVLLLLFGASAARLGSARRRWPSTQVDGVDVRITPGLGPAAVGLLRPEVILPGWVLDQDPEDRRWIVAHEAEHVRARDPALVMVSILAALLVPWNPAFWWNLRRIRLAVETDCDARVLGASPALERRRYASLLLEMGMRSVRGLPLAAFAESPDSLEHRIKVMTRSTPSHPFRRIALLSAAGAVLLTGACMVPGPDRQTSITGPELGDQPTAATSPEGLAEEPTFTPFTVAPGLLNAPEVAQALEDAYQGALRDAGVEGVTRLYFFVGADGVVRDVRIHESSGHDGLDAVAMEVAEVMRFSPGMNRDEAVPVWISLPIDFGRAPRSTPSTSPEESESPAPAPDARSLSELAEEPTFTPYTVAPQLQNPEQVMAALEGAYPPELRDEGVGGKALIYFLIGADGSVRDVRINESSGLESLDAAALEVAGTMRFTPARNGEENPVPVWISLPISFGVR